jgi:hypothetical protein
MVIVHSYVSLPEGKPLDDGFGELPISGQKRLKQNFVSCFIIRQQKSPAGRWPLG